MANLLPRLLAIPIFQIDTNAINGTQNDANLNKLEQWNEDGVICLNMSHIARVEAKKNLYIPRIQKADAQIYTIDEEWESGIKVNPNFYEEVRTALFSKVILEPNEENDVLIVCEAIKFGASLITSDGNSKNQPGGILGNKEKLSHRLRIFSPLDAVNFVRVKIKERDDFNRQFITHYRGALPPWTGTD